MKNYLFIFFLLCSASLGFAQSGSKPPLDTSVFSHWDSSLRDPYLSPDGKFAVSFKDRLAYGVDRNSALILHDLSNGKIRQFRSDARNVSYSANARFVLFKNTADTLTIVDLKTWQATYLPGTTEYAVKDEKLFYNKKDLPGTLFVKDLPTNKELSFPNVRQFIANADAAKVLVVASHHQGMQLSWFDEAGGRLKAFWTGEEASDLLYISDQNKWYFKGKTDLITGLYSWAPGEGAALPLKAIVPAGLQPDYVLGRVSYATANGRYLFYGLTATHDAVQPSNGPSILNVWSYEDARMRDYYNANIGTDTLWSPMCALDTKTGRCFLVTNKHEHLDDFGSQLAWIKKSRGHGLEVEQEWNRYSGTEPFVMNLSTGKTLPLKTKDLLLSRAKRYGLTFNDSLKKFFVHETVTGAAKMIKIPDDVDLSPGLREDSHDPTNYLADVQWAPDDRYVLVRDRYDIWKIDPARPEKPQCISNGYGKAHHIIFSFFSFDIRLHEGQKNLIVFAKDEDTQQHGFFQLDLSGNSAPVKLSMADCDYKNPLTSGLTTVILRTSAAHSPTFVVTKDFRQFTELSPCSPEASYNWLTSELHYFTLPDGRRLPGALLKPENFDPQKKYPVILGYYQKLGELLHNYPSPENTRGSLNVAWMVSHGYLVFIPDIITQYDHPAESAFQCILAAGHYLKTLPYVDPKGLGLAGHSFGGFETAYMVTHTNEFAAAYAGSPITDLILGYYNTPGFFKNGQTSIGTLIWSDPRPYYENSAFYLAHKVTTPLLMMGNKRDFLWPQAPIFFNGLRRLGKPCWMLEYKNSGHTVHDAADIDLTVRVQQFFDYYLKGETAPTWMVVPGSTSLALDPQKRNPGPGLLTPEAKKSADSLLTRPNINVSF